MLPLVLYVITLLSLSVYSFVLLDPNITFFNNQAWSIFRDWAVNIGYYQREMSWYIYLFFVIVLFAFHFYFLKKGTIFKAPVLALVIGGILTLAYPLISHDFFNYMFDAKILTFYHKNPYLFAPMDFPNDPWLRFMHWVHRPYPYGPVFLAISIVPAFIGMGKFILHFYLLKMTVVVLYILGVYFLYKINKRYALFFATNPLVLIEGLLAGHNDLMAVCLGIIGLYYIFNDKQLLGRVMMVLSIGIKYITLPYIILSKADNKNRNILAFIGLVIILGYFTFFQVIQPWYFLNLFVFIPLFPKTIERMQIFFFGLLMSYYPYIRLGGWDTEDKVVLKEQIILVFTIINVLYFVYVIVKERFYSSANAASSSKVHKKART